VPVAGAAAVTAAGLPPPASLRCGCLWLHLPSSTAILLLLLLMAESAACVPASGCTAGGNPADCLPALPACLQLMDMAEETTFADIFETGGWA
jgi:hypothetical protein